MAILSSLTRRVSARNFIPLHFAPPTISNLFMNKWLKLVLILILALGGSAALYLWVSSDIDSKIARLSGGAEITSSELGLALLTGEEAETALSLPGVLLPCLVYFNDQIATDDVAKYAYSDLVTRAFVSKQSGGPVADVAISLFPSAEAAEQFLQTKADEAGVAVGHAFDDDSLTEVDMYPGGEDGPPSLTLRFAVQNMVGRVLVYGNNDVFDVTDAGLLVGSGDLLARDLKLKMETLASGQLPGTVTWTENFAFNRFPWDLEGGTFIGLNPITQYDWLGETNVLDREITGFMSGVSGTFKLNEQEGYVVDILIVEFDSHEHALAEQATLLTEGAQLEDLSSRVITLPSDLSEFSLGRSSDLLAEIQSVDGVYLYDISVFAPFEDTDRSLAEAQVVEFTEQIFSR